MLKISTDKFGKFQITCRLIHPVVYLDHCAIVEFANNPELGKKFINALKNKNGTLLMSSINFFEAAGFNDVPQAQRIEEFLDDSLPNVYVADFMKDPGFFFPNGSPDVKGEPKKHWLAEHMLLAAKANGGTPTFRTMFTEVVNQNNSFSKSFDDLKVTVAETVDIFRNDPERNQEGDEFTPDIDMYPPYLLMASILRDTQINLNQKFGPNDSIDFVHSISSVVRSDFVFLDRKWCNRVNRAEQYLAKFNVSLNLARRYWPSSNQFDAFFDDLGRFPC